MGRGEQGVGVGKATGGDRLIRGLSHRGHTISRGITVLARAYLMAGSRHDLKSQGSCGANDSACDRLQLEVL